MDIPTRYRPEAPSFPVQWVRSVLDTWSNTDQTVLLSTLRMLIKAASGDLSDVKLAHNTTYLLIERLVSINAAISSTNARDKATVRALLKQQRFFGNLTKDVSIHSSVCVWPVYILSLSIWLFFFFLIQQHSSRLCSEHSSYIWRHSTVTVLLSSLPQTMLYRWTGRTVAANLG